MVGHAESHRLEPDPFFPQWFQTPSQREVPRSLLCTTLTMTVAHPLGCVGVSYLSSGVWLPSARAGRSTLQFNGWETRLFCQTSLWLRHQRVDCEKVQRTWQVTYYPGHHVNLLCFIWLVFKVCREEADCGTGAWAVALSPGLSACWVDAEWGLTLPPCFVHKASTDHVAGPGQGPGPCLLL